MTAAGADARGIGRRYLPRRPFRAAGARHL